MSHAKHAQPVQPHELGRRWAAGIAAAAVVAASAIASSPPALAASEPDQSGVASILDATVLGADIGGIVDPLLNPVAATTSGVTTGLVDGSSLADVSIGGYQILGTNDGTALLGLDSAVNSVVLDPTGTSSADSSVAGLSVNVGQFLAGTPLEAAFSDLSLTADALSANSTAVSGTAPDGSTSIAGLTLNAESPIVSTLTTTISSTVTPVIQTFTNTVSSLLSAIPGAPTINADIATLLAPILSDPFTANGVTINPATGEVTFDLDQILGSTVTSPDPNTELFSAASLAIIADALAAAVDSYTQELVQSITDAVGGIQLSFSPVLGTGLSGTVTLGQLTGLDPTPMNLNACAPFVGCVLPAGNLLGAITAPLALAGTTLQTAVSTAVNTAVDPLLTVLSPALDAITTVLDVTLNEQTTPAVEGEPFTTTALSVDILGGTVAHLGLANATIDAAATPFITSADTVPAGGTTPVDGFGFAPGETITVQLVDPAGNPVGAPVTVTADANGQFSTTLPIPADAAPGDYTISATGPTSGTVTTPIAVTAAPTLTAQDPVIPAGGTTTITGTGYTPDSTVTVTTTAPDGTTTTQTVTAGPDGTITFDFPTTAGQAQGDYTFTATDPSGASATTTLTVGPAPAIDAPPAAAAGDTVTVPGTGFTPDQPVHVVVTAPDGTIVFEGDVTAGPDGSISADIPLPADAAPGAYLVTATDPTGASASDAVAVANPVIDAPATALPGDTATVTGTGFVPGETVTVQLTDPAGNPVGDPVTVTAGPDGSITADVPVPADAAGGEYTVTATGATSGAEATDTMVVVNPSLTADQTPIVAGGTSTITGSGFTPGSPVDLTITNPDGTTQTVTVTSDAAGNVTYDFVTTSATPEGTYTFTATDTASGAVTDPVTVEVLPPPTITADDPSIPAGGSTTVLGQDWVPGDTVTVQLTDGAGNPVGDPVTAVVAPDGTISVDLPTDPATPPGSYTIVATDTSGATATTPLEVTAAPTVDIVPATTDGTTGGDLPITGTGYTPSSPVTLQLTDPAGNPVGDPITVTSDDAGNITGTVPLPADSAGGLWSVVATDVDSGAQATDTVVVVNPSLTPEQPTLPAGGTTTINGTGFTPNSAITVVITAPDGTTTTTTVTSDADGNLSFPLTTTPDSPQGDWTITAMDPSGATPATTVTVTPPPTVDAPASVPAGDTATITGTGYTPNEPVHVVVTAPDGSVVFEGDVTAAPDGTITVDVPIPADAAPGEYTVTTTDVSGATATDTFAVANPAIDATPATVVAGDPVPVTGTGFTPGGEVVLTLTDATGNPVLDDAGNPVTVTVTAGPDGTLPAGTALVTPDGLPAGDYTVVATDSASGAQATDTVAVTNADITLTDDSIPAGGTTTVNGTGFTPGGPVTVQLVDSAGNPVGDPITVTAGPDGTFSVDVSTTADTPPGAYAVQATDTTTGEVEQAALTVTEAPAITPTPATIPAGGTSTVTGTGFTPDSPIAVVVTAPDGTQTIQTVQSDATGAITVDVPTTADDPTGTWVITATDPSGAEATASLEVTAAPTVDAPPATTAGATETITGTGYTPDQPVHVVVTDAAGTVIFEGDVTAAPDGTITVDVPIPADATRGTLTVTATDSSGAVGTDTMEVLAPALTADDDIVAAGGTVPVTGSGYLPGETVSVQLLDPAGNPVGSPVTVVADATGAFTVDVPVPADAPAGDYTVEGTGETSGVVASDTVTVANPTLAVTDPSVPAGGTTPVTGDGFAPGETVTIQLLDPAGNPVGDPITVTAGPDGTISADVPVPAGAAPGDYTVEATGADSGAVATDGLAVTPAPTVDAPPVAVAGDPMTVTGTGYTPDQPVHVVLTAPDGTVVWEGDVTAAADGTITTDIPVPAGAVAGDYTVTTTDVSGATATDTVAIANPVIAVEDPVLPAGGTTTVDGAGFTPGETVTIQLLDPAGNPVGDPITVVAAPDGTITAEVPVPADAVPGDYTVEATGGTSGGVATDDLTVTAPPAVDAPPAAAAGDPMTVTGDGFTPNEPVHVVLTAPDGTIVWEGDVTAAPDGTITTDVPVPADAVPGEYTVTATDSSGATATDTVQVANPTITVVDDTLPAGGTTPVTGDGFAPGETVTVQLLDPAGNPVGDPVIVIANPDGTISADITVPADTPPGAYTVEATGSDSGAVATDELTVTPAPTVDAPPAAAAGDTMTVTGTGYTTDAPVHVVLTAPDGTVVWEGDVTAGPDGTITVDIPVPADAIPGEYTVTTTDSSGATATDTVQVANPTLTVVDPTVPAGGTTPVTGDGFVPGETVTVQLLDPAGNPVGDPITVVAGPDGTISADVPIPADAAPGDYSVAATGSDSGATATDGVTVTPAPTLDAPPAAAAGDTITVTGTGYSPDEPVHVVLTAPDGTVVWEGDVTAGPDGTITVDVPVPADAVPGEYTVTATDSSGATATDTVQAANPTLTVVDPTVPAGGTTTVTGDGFIPGETVTVQLLDPAGNPVGDPITVVAGPDGTITADVPVPADAAPGDYTVEATGSDSGATASDALTVTAAPTVDAPPAAAAGDTMTVTGDGYSPDEPVHVVLTAPDGTVVWEGDVTAGPDGTITVDIPVPADAVPGEYTVTATDSSGATATDTVQVANPTITVVDDSVPAGGTTPITGDGFAPGEPVTIQLVDPDGNPVGDPIIVIANPDGTISADITVPADAAPGAYTVEATGSDSGATATDGLTVTPAPTVDAPAAVAAGDTMTVTGDGYTPGDPVHVVLTAPDGTVVWEGDVTAAADGTITVDIPVPADAVPGEYTVTTTDSSGAMATDTVAVANPTITVADDTVPAGGTTMVTGDGFAPGETVTVQLLDPAGNPVGDPITTVADATGAISVDVPVPADAVPGDYTVAATGSDSGATATDGLTVLEPPFVDAPPAAAAGDTMTVTGDGFTPNEPVHVVLTAPDGTVVWEGDVTAAADGTITVDIPVPADAVPGEYTVTATDSSGATATDTVQVANPTLTVVDPTVPAGGTTTVTGDGFVPGESVTVQLLDPAGNPVGDPITVVADDTGAISVDVLVPADAAPGDYTVEATGGTSGATASDGVTVTPAPTVDAPPVAAAGQPMTVTGDGYTPGEPVHVVLTAPDGTVVWEGDVTAAADGTITVDIPVPADAVPGDYTVTATDSSGATATDTVPVLNPTLTVADPTVPAGGTTTVTGDGFLPGETVTVQLLDPAGSPVGDPITVVAGPDGTITADVPVPADAAPGDYTVEATGSDSGAVASDDLTVTPAPTVDAPPAAAAGDTMTVTGDGYSPGEPVHVVLTAPDGTVVWEGDVTAAADGTITVDIPVPADAVPGQYTVTATDSSGATATDTVQVANPTLTVVDDSVPAGGTTTVTGDGFVPGETVTVQLTDPDGNPVGDPVTVVAGPDGTITADVPIPADAAPGDYTVEATGSDSGATASDTVTVTPAPTVDAPPTAAAGDTITVTGTGYTPGDTVHVVLTGPDGTVVWEGDTTAAADGTITVDIAVPADAPAGEYTVEATDSSGATATDTLQVANPTVDAPPAAAAGQDMTVTGDGFAPGEVVSVTLTDPDGNVIWSGDVTAGDDGTITVDVPVPSDAAPGDYTVEATGADSGATASDTVAVANPSIELSDGSVPPGGTTTVTGDGFAPVEHVTVVITDDAGNVYWEGEVISGPDGTISLDIDVPGDLPPGDYTVVAVGQSSGASAEAPLEVTPAPDITVVTPGTPGGTVHVGGDGFTPGGQVVVVISGPGGTIGQVVTTADENGQISVDVPIPAGTAPGMYTVTATDVTSGLSDSALAQVTAAGLTPPQGRTPAFAPASGVGSLPRTGSDAAGLAVASVLLLLGGLLTVVATRRRRGGEA